MAPKFDYDCTECGERVGRENLTTKTVTFATIGKPARRLKTRTTAWLCQRCLNLDPAWAAEKHHGSPGFDFKAD